MVSESIEVSGQAGPPDRIKGGEPASAERACSWSIMCRDCGHGREKYLTGGDFAVFFGLKRLVLIPWREVWEQLQNGAIVVDDSSGQKVQSRHLPVSVNVLLEQLDSLAHLRFPDESQVLLLHCRSGHRSSMARRIINS